MVSMASKMSRKGISEKGISETNREVVQFLLLPISSGFGDSLWVLWVCFSASLHLSCHPHNQLLDETVRRRKTNCE